MPIIGAAEILVRPVTTGIQKQIGQEMDKTATSAGKSSGSKMGSALGGAMKLGVGVAAAGVVGVLGAAVTKGFSRLQAIENARAKLLGLGHDADTVAGIMKNATASVKGTAFGLDEAATVAAGAVASGIAPGKELERTLKLVADGASIAGVPMSEMGAIFNKVASSGKLQGDVLAQLGDKGIPIVSLLGKSMGKTSAEIYEMSRKGTIDFAAFQKAMEEGMGGAALKSGDTLQGAFKNTQASLGRVGANLLSGVYPLFTKFFQGLIKWMEPLEAKAKVVGEAIGVAMTKGIEAIGGLYDVLVKGDFTTRFAEAFHVEEDSKLTDFLFNVREGLVKTAGVIQGAAAILFKGDFIGSSIMGFEEDSKFVDFLFKLREGFLTLGDALGGLKFSSWEAFKESVADGGSSVGGAFASIFDSLKTLGPAFQEFGRQLPNITGAFMKLGGLSLNVIVAGLGFLADHVDTIIKFMPLIVAAFIAWRVATKMLATAQFSLQAAQVAAAPVLLANNILRYASVRAETALAVATGQTTRATQVSLAMKIKDRVATMLGTAATLAAAAAQKVAAFTTKALGIALKVAMGPIGWVIAGVALLVTGLVWFFTKTKLGQSIVQKAFAAIKSAIAAVVDWWGNTLVPALKSVGQWFKDVWDAAAKAVDVSVQWMMDAAGNVASFFDKYVAQPVKLALKVMGDAFTWLYKTIIKPVFDSISVIAYGFYLGFRGICQLVVAVFKEIIAPGFMFFWRGVVEPVFRAVGDIVSKWWTGAKLVFDLVVGFIRGTLGVAFTWLRDSVIGPVFNWIGDKVTKWWNATKLLFDLVVFYVRQTLGVAFTWLRDSVINPVFSWIGDKVSKWWDATKLVFDVAVGFIRGTLGAAFTWFRDSIINPVFNSVRDKISNVWNSSIKPVFDFMSSTIKTDVPKAFQTGIDAIKKIWDTLKAIAKAPVKFMIDTVINKGLIGSFNKVAGMLPGIDQLPEVDGKALGFARGGWTGPGSKYTPAGVVHADEFVIRKESQNDLRKRAPGFLDSLNRFGAKALGYANGGIVNPLKHMALTQGYNRVHKGIDLAASVGTPVFATQGGVVTLSGPGASAPGVFGGNEVHVAGGGLETWFAHLSQMMVRVGETVRAGQQIGLSGNTGITSGPHLHFGVFNGGWPNDVDPNSYLGGAIQPADGAGGGFNPVAALAGMAKDKLSAAFPGGGKMVEMAIGTGEKLIGGVSEWVTKKLGSLVDSAVSGVKSVANDVGMRAKWMPSINAALIRSGHGDLGIVGNSESMYRRMMQESGGDPNAVNNWDSNAAAGIPSKGLMQVIDPNFATYRDKALSSNIFDPMANLVAAINYTQDKYGNLRKGWDQDGGYANGGLVNPLLYDNGGVLRPGLSHIVNATGKPEAILNPRQWEDMHQLATNGGAPSQFTGNLYLDSGEFMGKVTMATNQAIKSADQQSAYSRVGR